MTRLVFNLCRLAWIFVSLTPPTQGQDRLHWRSLAELPAPPEAPRHPGVAGAFAGVHRSALLLAGGANFPQQSVWDSAKIWHDEIYRLERNERDAEWRMVGRLPFPLAYGASVSTQEGLICMGGDTGEGPTDEVFGLVWDPRSRTIVLQGDYPQLPRACAYGQATLVDSVIYLAGGQDGPGLERAMSNFWTLDLRHRGTPAFAWKERQPWPGPERAFNLVASQHNGFDDCVYVMSGRRQEGAQVEFLRDVWEYNVRRLTWRARAPVPRCVMAGTVIAYGHSHLFVLGGADGRLWHRAESLRERHPGFPKEALAFHTITDTWTSAGPMPANHVTTTAVMWDDEMIIPSGEIRPRVRSPRVWAVKPMPNRREFGRVNHLVLTLYLLAMVAVGASCAKRNRTTDDYFRGGKRIAWWSAGASIFATMLSSLTFTGLPAKAYAQDWVYLVGNLMIPVVALVAVYLALPFYRRIDATSAYEYLERRFSRSVRLVGSGLFTVFHLFRMGVVMSLTGLALAVATPLSPAESVLLIGLLSILYATIGGIEAVIWTDTIQAVVLLGGALLALGYLMAGIDGGFEGFVRTANAADKFQLAHVHMDITSTQIALWIIVLGAIGQNVSSYTADQAVVQRYLTTADEKQAARSIWTNAILAIIASFLFFGIGSALFAFYHSHPERLDPTITTDQIFPLFIATEMPVGLSGLIVAGIFAAAQSTVSTSMNSTATTVVTDFMRPLRLCRSEAGYFRAARILTATLGLVGCGIGLLFVDPDIKSLFDTFLSVIGLFMGILGGLFVLGALTRRANSTGALGGGLAGAAIMFWLWQFTDVIFYAYTAIGITTCFTLGYLISLVLPGRRAVDGLTIHSLK